MCAYVLVGVHSPGHCHTLLLSATDVDASLTNLRVVTSREKTEVSGQAAHTNRLHAARLESAWFNVAIVAALTSS